MKYKNVRFKCTINERQSGKKRKLDRKPSLMNTDSKGRTKVDYVEHGIKMIVQQYKFIKRRLNSQ